MGRKNSRAIARDRKARAPKENLDEILGPCMGKCGRLIMRKALMKHTAIRIGDKYLCCVCEGGPS